jgi:ABC-2 type transport system permease protein
MPGWLRSFVEANSVSWMTTAMRDLMAGTASLTSLLKALAAPALLTAVLMPATQSIYRRK